MIFSSTVLYTNFFTNISLKLLQESSGTKSTAVDENGFTKSQLENLYWYYSQFENADDTVGAIIEIYKRSCSVAKTRLSVKNLFCYKNSDFK